MRPIVRIVLLGAIAVLAFDAIAGFLALGQHVDFTGPGYSYLIYVIAGFAAAKVAGWKGATVAGIALGLIDATLGVGVMWLIGGGSLPPGVASTPRMLGVMTLTATVSALALALLGAAVARMVGGKPQAASG